MRNPFTKFLETHGIEVNERTWIDIVPGLYSLSIIPEYNHHYRDENDRMHISPRDQPVSVQLNTYLFKSDGKYYDTVPDADYVVTTTEELKEYLDELKKKYALIQDN
jgi:hypothetical protein